MVKLVRIPVRGAFLVAAICALAGCAVQSGSNGKVQIGIDNAELFGQEIGRFTLIDGSEGTLRTFNGQYSIKLAKYSKIVAIDRAVRARVVRVNTVADRTLVVLEKSERNCNYKTQVLSIRGAEVLTWDLGDCNTRPAINANPDAVTFDFVQPHSTARFTYHDMRIFRSDFPTAVAPPSAAASGRDPLSAARAPDAKPATPGAMSTASPRYVPGLPLEVASLKEANPAPANPQVASTVEARTDSVTPVAVRPVHPTAPLPKPLDFPVTEQKAVRIYLAK